MAILKRALIALGVLLLIPVVVLAAVLAYLTTASGLATIASLTSRYASSADTKIAIGGIEGTFPTDLTFRNVRLADSKGEWLTLDRLRFVWSPLSLYSRKLIVNLVDVGEVKVARQPSYPEQDENLPPPDPNAPLFPELPIEIHLEKLTLASLDLAEPVIGTPAKLAATASATVRKPADGVAAEFDLRRIDSTPGQIAGHGRFIPATNGVEISLRGSEPAGGLVARMANIPGLPPIDIGLDGAGTLDNLRAQLAVVAGSQGRMDGVAELKRDGAMRRATMALTGDVGRLVAPDYTPMLTGATKIDASAIVPDEGPIQIETVAINAPAAQLSARGSVDTSADTLDISYDLHAAEPGRFATLLPQGLGWTSLTLLGTAKGPIDRPTIDATVTGGGLVAQQGSAETADIHLVATPNGPVMQEGTRVAFRLDGKGAGVKFADDRLFSLGRDLSLTAAGTTTLAGDANLDSAKVMLAGVSATYAGVVSTEAAKGRATLDAADLSTLSALAGRTLAGSVDLTSNIDLAYDLSRLVADVDGKATGLQTSVTQVDALTGGAVTIKGGVSRSADGSFALQGLDVRGEHLTVTADGSATRAAADVKAHAEVDDLVHLDGRASGKAIVDAALTGKLENLGVKATVRVPDGKAMGRTLKDVAFDADATDVTGALGGSFALSGALDGKPLRGAGRLTTEDSGVRRLVGLDLAIASTTAKGDVTVSPKGVATGRLALDAPDLADVGALALTELAGRLKADITLADDSGVQRATIDATGADIVSSSARIGTFEIATTIIDPTGKVTIDGSMKAGGVVSGGQTIDQVSLVARGAPDGMDVSLKAAAKGSAANADARVVYRPDQTQIDVSRLDLAGGGKSARLTAPARVRIAGSDVVIDAFSLRASDGGLLNVTGHAGEKLDLKIGLRELPLALGNAFTPGLGLGGSLEGDATVTGTPSAPEAVFDIRGADLSIAQLRDAKVPALTLATKGTLKGDRVVTDTTVTGAGGLSLSAQGSAPLGEGDLDMTVALRSVPLALANVAMPELALAGVLQGDAKIAGPLSAPRGTYDVKIASLTSARAKEAPPLAVTARGTLDGGRVTTDAAITGGGVSLVARGSAPLGKGDLDMTVNIRALPLALANAVQADLGLGGALKGDVRVSGPIDAPVGDYNLSITRLEAAATRGLPPLDVTARGALQGKQVTTDATVTGGGIDVAAKGAGPLGDGPLDLSVVVKQFPLKLANAFAPDVAVDGSARGTAAIAGTAAAPTIAYDVTLDGVTSQRAIGVAPLTVVAKGSTDLKRVVTDALLTGGGGVEATMKGSAPLGRGDLDMAIAIRDLPLSLANSVRPDLGLSGALKGDVTLSGPVARPVGRYDVHIANLVAAQAKGAPPLQVAARGELQGVRVTTDTTITGQGGVSLIARGSAPIGDGDLDMNVTIDALPLSLANGFKPELGLAGVAKGAATITGPVKAPQGTYDLTISGLTSAQAKGVPPLAVTTKGALDGARVTTDTAITGGGGVGLTAKGSAPLSGEGAVDMTVAISQLPLALANAVQPSLGLGGTLRGGATVRGTIAAPTGDYDLSVVDLTAAAAKGVAPLQIAAKGTLEGQRVTTDTAITGGGGVGATARGAVPLTASGGEVDLTVDVAELPLAIANGVVPSLGLGGKLAGGAKIGGSFAEPAGDYDFKVSNLTSAQAKGVAPIQIGAKGALAGGRVTTDTVVTGGGGLRVTVGGSAPISAGDLDLTVAIRSVPLSLANAFSPGLGANGTLQGDAKIGGPIAAPTGTYTLKVTGLSTAATRGAGVPAAQIDAKGALAGQRVTTDTVVTAASGLRVTARGSAPLGAGDLDLAVAGRAPLAFLNDTLSVSGDRIDGVATFDVKIAGSTTAPKINGTGALANATYFNRVSGLQLRGLGAQVSANGSTIDIRSLKATTRNGGSISGSGRVNVDPTAGFPGDVRFNANNAEVVGTDVVTAVTDADLRLQGPLARRPVVTGTIRTRSVDIQIPDKIPARYTPLPDVTHRGAPAAVMKQYALRNTGKTKGGKADEGFVATLDIDVQANDHIFIRGLGMNAEAGGQIKVTGTSAAPQPVGAFQLRQGRSQITVIGKRLEFTRGAVAFAGDLDPTLDFLAETQAGDITAQVIVTGTASSPQITFGSNPSVPTDEVLARLLFNKSSGELSPSQAITLAQAVAQYSGVGGGGGGPLESLRKGLGVDSLDLAAGGDGGGLFGLGIGRYISDNIYLGFATGTTPQDTGVTVDIDLTNHIKARGQAGAAGNTSAGVAAEWDY